MSDINIYENQAAIDALTPISGDLVVDRGTSTLHLCTGTSPVSWKIFTPDENELPPAFSSASLSFDGSSDYLDLGSSFAPFNFGTGDFTISLWFKPRSLSSTAYTALVGTHNNNNTVWSCYVRSDGFYIYGGGALTGGGTISTDQWYHGLVTRNSGTVTVYVDNSVVASVTNTGQYNSNSSSNSKIGGDNTNGSNPNFNGFIDEVAVWNSGLSASEIASLRDTSGANPVPANISSLNPSAWWRMGDDAGDSFVDGGSVASITDSSGNGNTATQATAANQPTFSISVPS